MQCDFHYSSRIFSLHLGRIGDKLPPRPCVQLPRSDRTLHAPYRSARGGQTVDTYSTV
jgi:hypothetical protein